MKMLMIFTHIQILLISLQITLTALKYETPMFQEFRTQNRTHVYLITVLFLIWVYVYALFFKLTFFKAFPRHCQCFPVISMQIFDFKNSL